MNSDAAKPFGTQDNSNVALHEPTRLLSDRGEGAGWWLEPSPTAHPSSDARPRVGAKSCVEGAFRQANLVLAKVTGCGSARATYKPSTTPSSHDDNSRSR